MVVERDLDDEGGANLREIAVDPSIYTDNAINLERNRDWRELWKGNLMLLRDQPAEARAIFQALSGSGNPAAREAADESLARAAKAMAGAVGPGNEILRARSTTTQP